MDQAVYAALTQLDELLPLAERQAALAPELAALHRGILRTLALQGRMPTVDEMRTDLPQGDLYAALATLAHQDLIVLDGAGQPVGAYPMTLAPTSHRVRLHGHGLYAMCAIDALAIAPLFTAEVHIDSVCRVSGEPIRIRQQGGQLLSVSPGRGVHAGVRWRAPEQCAAHSLCLEMVFLRDAPTAAGWAAQWEVPVSVLNLEQAVEFGAAFFRPLLA